MATMGRVQAGLNTGLEIEGVLLTMVDPRTRLGQQVAGEVRQHCKEKVYATTIPRNVRLGEAPSYGVPAILYDGPVYGRGGVPGTGARDPGQSPPTVAGHHPLSGVSSRPVISPTDKEDDRGYRP